MAFADTLYAPRLGLEQIERGRTNTLKCPVYRDGVVVAPSAASFTLYNPAGTAVVSAAAGSIVSSVAQYALTSATVSSYSYGDGWAVEWTLAMPDSVAHTFRTDAALVRRSLYPVVSDVELFARVPGLSPSAAAPLTRATTYQDRIDEAWRMLTRRLLIEGHLPWLTTDAHAFREAHLCLSLSLVFRDLATRTEQADGLFASEAQRYAEAYEAAYRTTRIRVDRDEDGAPDSTTRKPAASVVWFGGGAPWRT